MSDEIKGVAVLDDRGPEHFLFCVCVPDKTAHKEWNAPFIQRLPVRAAGTPKIHEHQWEYQVDGLIVRMHPSVKVTTTRPVPGTEDDPKGPMQEVELFHNGYSWWIHFIRWSDIAAGRGEHNDSRWLACNELNAALLTSNPDPA